MLRQAQHERKKGFVTPASEPGSRYSLHQKTAGPRLKAGVTAVLLVMTSARPVEAQAPPPTLLAAIPALADRLLAVLGGAGTPDRLFTATFLAASPEPIIRKTSASLTATLGAPVRIAAIVPTGARTARVTVVYQRGTAMLDLGVAPDGRIGGLRIAGTATAEADLSAVAASFAALPGTAAFSLARLGDAGPVPIAGRLADMPLAVASACKLAIFAELVRSVDAGERRWTDTITFDGLPLPPGSYAKRPAGTRANLAELAHAMIARSDNSASDILLFAVGRERVEAILPLIGWQAAARNRPFLSMLELFKLKTVADGAWARRWRDTDETGRRALLAGAIAEIPAAAIDPFAFRADRPLMPDIEWFASADDLVRTMDWLRRNTDGPSGGEARAILAANPGIGPANVANWRWVGFKGGSEPGVLDLTLLLQRRDGAWYALSAAWNDPARGLDEPRFVALISRAADLVADLNLTSVRAERSRGAF